MAKTTTGTGMTSGQASGNPRRPIVLIVGTEFDFSREPRIIQEILALKDQCVLMGYGKGGHPDIDQYVDFTQDRGFVDRVLDIVLVVMKYYVPYLLRFRHRKLLKWMEQIEPDMISTHHLESAYVVVKQANYLTFNSHEYIPRMYDGSWMWRWTKGWLIRNTMPEILKKSQVMFVESEAVAMNYRSSFDQVPQIAIVPNTARWRNDLTPVTVTGHPIRLVHHGIASPGRGLEMLVDAVNELGAGYELSLYVVGSSKHVSALKEYAHSVANVHFPDPVSYDQIIPEMNSYDIGLCMFRSSNYHTLYTTVPNKFWEYLAARVVPLVWDKSAMATVLNTYQVGLQCSENSVNGIVERIKSVTVADLDQQKQKIDQLQSMISAEELIDPVLRRFVPGL